MGKDTGESLTPMTKRQKVVSLVFILLTILFSFMAYSPYTFMRYLYQALDIFVIAVCTYGIIATLLVCIIYRKNSNLVVLLTLGANMVSCAWLLSKLYQSYSYSQGSIVPKLAISVFGLVVFLTLMFFGLIKANKMKSFRDRDIQRAGLLLFLDGLHIGLINLVPAFSTNGNRYRSNAFVDLINNTSSVITGILLLVSLYFALKAFMQQRKEQARIAEQQRIQLEMEQKRKEEEEKRQREEEERRKQEQERQRKAEEERRRREEENRRREEERRQREAEERRKREEENRRREEERRQREAEERRKQEEENKRKVAKELQEANDLLSRKGNTISAFRHVSSAAQLGDSGSQLILGIMYLCGTGTDESLHYATYWLGEASHSQNDAKQYLKKIKDEHISNPLQVLGDGKLKHSSSAVYQDLADKVLKTYKEKKEAEEKRKKEEAERLEMERKRREEEEEKRKKEEAERLEIEKKQREEEEARRQEEEKRKKAEQRKKAQEKLEKAFLPEMIASNKLAQPILLNPFNILGLPAFADKNEANAVADKVKKLIRIKAVSSFKPRYALNDIPQPERELSIIEGAVHDVDNKLHHWLWFSEEDTCQNWKVKKYQDQDENYDQFLASYLYNAIIDEKFENKTSWVKLLKRINDIVTNKKDLLCQHLHQEIESIDENCLRAVFAPIYQSVSDGDPVVLVNIYKIADALDFAEGEHLANKTFSGIITWIEQSGHELSQITGGKRLDQNISSDECSQLTQAIHVYLERTEEILPDVIKALKGNKKRLELVQKKSWDTLWQALLLLDTNDAAAALEIANTIYPKRTEAQKSAIRKEFGYDRITGSEAEATAEEIDLLGDMFSEGTHHHRKNQTKAAECYKKAAEMGNNYSMNSLGICYSEGKGVSKSDRQACVWFRKAGEAGNPSGWYNLALRYLKGEGVSQSDSEAEKCLKKAAAAGMTAANELLDKIQEHNNRAVFELGYQSVSYYSKKIAYVTSPWECDIMLMDSSDYRLLNAGKQFSYYGGRVEGSSTPYRIEIPESGTWYVVVCNFNPNIPGLSDLVRCSVRSY